MGVLTTIYSVPVPMMKKIKADHDNLGFLFGVEESGGDAWKCETFECDKGFEERIGILGENGYPKTKEALDLESADEEDPSYDGYDVRVVSPATVKKIAKEIASATAAELTKAGVKTERVNKVHEGRPHVVDAVKSGDVQLIINIPTDVKTRNDALEIRLAALQYSIPYFTTVEAAREAITGIVEMRGKKEQIYVL